jgi:hypothetical protein
LPRPDTYSSLILLLILLEILMDSMVEVGRVYLKNVPVVVDVSVAENWAEKA